MSDEGGDQTAFLYCLMQDLTDTLEFSIPEATDAITPEEREELKVSGQCWLLSQQRAGSASYSLTCRYLITQLGDLSQGSWLTF